MQLPALIVLWHKFVPEMITGIHAERDRLSLGDGVALFDVSSGDVPVALLT